MPVQDETTDLDAMYRMPVVFGPAPGPRNLPRSRRHLRYAGDALALSVIATCDAAALRALLPERFSLPGEAVVEVSVMQLTNVGWLAGRGYNIVSVVIPAVFDGADGPVEGGFMPVLWESMADPILTGREELGFPKLPAEIPDPRCLDGAWTIEALWQGYRFFEMELTDLSDSREPAPPPKPGLFLKYMPTTGQWGQADVQQVTTTGAGVPSGQAPTITVHERKAGKGSFRFHAARWQDMPTQYPIVNALAQLEPTEFRMATLVRRSGQGDVSSQIILA